MDVTVSIFKEGSFMACSQVRRLYRTATGSTSAELNAIICMTDTSGVTKLFAMRIVYSPISQLAEEAVYQ